MSLLLDEGMMELFFVEVDTQTALLNNGIVTLEEKKFDFDLVHQLMRAAHSLKGAARVIGIDLVVTLAHALEDYFSSLQQNKIEFKEEHSDILFKAIDLLAKISGMPLKKIDNWLQENSALFDSLASMISALQHGEAPSEAPGKGIERIKEELESMEQAKDPDRVLRVTAQNLNRLMGLAGESMVESRWLQPFSDMLIRLKKKQGELSVYMDALKDQMKDYNLPESAEKTLAQMHDVVTDSQFELTNRITELDLFISRHSSLTDRLYNEVIDSRMRPFEDGIVGFPRLVRDLAKELGKKVRFEILGRTTQVDRDILEKLEAPLNHLLRNAVDHGVETPKVREMEGKPSQGTVTLEAVHKAGSLSITVSDDGKGIDYDQLKEKIKKDQLAKADIIDRLTKQELLDFLFLPGFTTTSQVTEISGRGVGLNIVQNMLQEVSGSIRVIEEPGKGVAFHMHLPLTLSVIRALTVEIAGEPYAFPLARINRAVLVPGEQIETIEGRQYFIFEEQNIGLLSAAEILGVGDDDGQRKIFPVVILKDHQDSYGIIVDDFLGERELVLQDLESRLGKVPNIAAGAFMEDGAPVLIIDVDDIINSIDSYLSGGRTPHMHLAAKKLSEVEKKRILVVDDSITVREVETRLLRNHGYEVETAVNGMDAWNALRLTTYDLIITDIDMPRMNGIELVQMIRKDPKFSDVPVMIVSYKEREKDRVLGMEAGADFYMTKSCFHDETLIEIVAQLLSNNNEDRNYTHAERGD